MVTFSRPQLVTMYPPSGSDQQTRLGECAEVKSSKINTVDSYASSLKDGGEAPEPGAQSPDPQARSWNEKKPHTPLFIPRS